MKISTKGRYGLRILLDLALNQGENPRMIKEIAKAQNISEKYISRLIIDLRRAGMVTSIRGARGGYRLALFPNEISLLEVVETMEGRISIAGPINHADECPPEVRNAQQIWADINSQIRAAMSAVNLQQILDRLGTNFDASMIGDYCI